MSAARIAAPLLALVLCSCSGDGRDLPEADEFAAGTCRTAAPAVLAIDEQVALAVEEDVDTRAVVDALRTEQGRLQELLADGDDVAEELQEVVTSVGFARAAVATDAIGDSEVRDVERAVDDLVAACTTPEG